jgi:hypothetical protein
MAEEPQLVDPSAKIPKALFPAAVPETEAAVAFVAKALVSPEYVYLFRVVVRLNPEL